MGQSRSCLLKRNADHRSARRCQIAGVVRPTKGETSRLGAGFAVLLGVLFAMKF